ncbi:hypothetical protein A245_02633, partial [Pseudomonas syringae pv. actinidiae ICMP 19096]
VFEHAGALQLQDPTWQRKLNIDTGDSTNTVVWHPGSRPLLGVCGSETTGFVRVEAASGSHRITWLSWERACSRRRTYISINLRRSYRPLREQAHSHMDTELLASLGDSMVLIKP